MDKTALRGPGGDLLFRALRQSTIGADAFHFRVRDGIGWDDAAITTRLAKSSKFYIPPLFAHASELGSRLRGGAERSAGLSRAQERTIHFSFSV